MNKLAALIKRVRTTSIEKLLIGLVYLFVVLLPLTYRGTIEVGFTVKLSEVVAILTFLVWICVRIRRGELKLNPKGLSARFLTLRVDGARWLDIFLFGFLAATALSLTQAINLERGIAWWLWLASYIFAVYYLISNLAADEKAVRGLLKTYVIVAAVLAAFAVYQFFADYMNLDFTWIRPTYSKYGTLGYPRPHATLMEPLYFGFYLLAPAIFLAVSFLSKKQLFFKAKTEGILLLLFLTVVVATMSRGAAAALAGAFVLLTLGYLAFRIFDRKRFFKIFAPLWPRFVALVLIVASTFPTFLGMTEAGLYLERICYTSTEAIARKRAEARAEESRLSIGDPRYSGWKRAWEMFKENPLLGVGWGNFTSARYGIASGITGPPDSEQGFGIVNSEPLEVAVEAGILGLIFYFGYNAVFIWLMLAAILRSVKKQLYGWLPLFAGFLLSFLAMSAQFLTFSTIQIGNYWLILGLGAVAYRVAFAAAKRKGA